VEVKMEFPKDEINNEEYETKVDYKAVFIFGLFIWISALTYNTITISNEFKNKVENLFNDITGISSIEIIDYPETDETDINIIKDKNGSIKTK
jgi:hypothetical protein